MKTLILLSGGLDSSTLAYHLAAEGHELMAVCINYGQRHDKELESARKIASHLAIPYRQINILGLGRLLKGSSLTDEDIDTPHGHYNEPSMKQTVVPGRNAIMLSIGWAAAAAGSFTHVAAAMHAGDHYIYPDCRPEFLSHIKDALALGTKGVGHSDMSLLTPFQDWTKADIAYRAAQLGLPIEDTWTCYEGLDVHCGRCGACCERILAMQEAAIQDPTPYADTEFAVSLEAAE